MLKTRFFQFDRKGHLTIFLSNASNGQLLRIMRMCNEHARRKKTKKIDKWLFIPTLAA